MQASILINLLLRNCHPYDDHDQKGTTQSKWRSARKLSPKPATSSSFPRLLKRQSRCCCISNNGKVKDHSQVCKSPLVKDCSVRVSPQCKILSQVWFSALSSQMRIVAVKAECWTKRREEEVEEDVAECQQVQTSHSSYCHHRLVFIFLSS